MTISRQTKQTGLVLLSLTTIQGVLLVPSTALAACTGVLVCNPDAGFSGYIKQLFSTMMPVVFGLALALIVYSGVQYMLGGLTPDNSKKAKQRIYGSLIGIIFYLLLRFIVNQIAPDLFIS